MDERPERSEGLEAAKLGLEVMFGARGSSVARYLDKRREDRHRERLSRLAGATHDAGLDDEQLVDRLQEDDPLQELFERVATAASSSRYDEKIDYLGKVLAAAVAGTSAARLDDAWMRVRAVEELEPLHVQVLWLIWNLQPGDSGVSRDRVVRGAREHGFDSALFEAGVGLLRHHGLLDDIFELDLSIDVTIEEPERGQMPTEASAETFGSEVDTAWRLTQLGTEVLGALAAAGGLDGDRMRKPLPADPGRLPGL